MTGGRAVWVVRHAEREDNINEDWRKLPSARVLTFANSMLSKRGREQAKECAARFRDVNITNVFASPFDRTIEAASIIVADKKLLIKPEPGLCDLLFYSDGTPGFWVSEKLKEKYPLDDTKYVPVFTKEFILHSSGNETTALFEPILKMGDLAFFAALTDA
ncbi:hypothetical protein RB195_005125 [Necator americanus]|uniref:Phosphoglycerate mutase family protein n=1 Tax=Necator americanus TaxID=51031 RepID=A0ABR1BQ69_NECAM